MLDHALQLIRQYYSLNYQAELWPPILYGMLAFFLIERMRPARAPNLHGAIISLRASCILLLLAPAVAAVPSSIVREWLVLIGETYFSPIYANMNVFAFWFDAPPHPVGYSPSIVASVLFVLLGALITDFFYYWFHRAQHTKWLWPQHKLHHSDASLCATTVFRHHWLEDTLRAFFMILPMGILFNLKPVNSALAGTTILLWGIFIHANLRLNMGPLTPLLCGPQYHRIHHSIEPRHQDKNFAAYFPFWDMVFGTYYRPNPAEFPETGVVGERSNLSVWDTLIMPFRGWLHIIRAHINRTK